MSTNGFCFEDYLSVNEIAGRLRVSPSTIRAWIKNGKIKATKKYGTVLRFRFCEVVKELSKGVKQC